MPSPSFQPVSMPSPSFQPSKVVTPNFNKFTPIETLFPTTPNSYQNVNKVNVKKSKSALKLNFNSFKTTNTELPILPISPLRSPGLPKS